MRIEDRLNKVEKSIPCTAAKTNYTPAQLKALAEKALTMSEAELEEISQGTDQFSLTMSQKRQMAEQYLKSIAAREKWETQ